MSEKDKDKIATQKDLKSSEDADLVLDEQDNLRTLKTNPRMTLLIRPLKRLVIPVMVKLLPTLPEKKTTLKR
jgi:hypothetical protein